MMDDGIGIRGSSSEWFAHLLIHHPHCTQPDNSFGSDAQALSDYE